MFVSLSEKKNFNLVSEYRAFGRREVLWILNYLLTHDAILNNVHFVENVENRSGIRVVADGLGKEPLLLLSKHKNLQIRNKFFTRFG